MTPANRLLKIKESRDSAEKIKIDPAVKATIQVKLDKAQEELKIQEIASKIVKITAILKLQIKTIIISPKRFKSDHRKY